jgi:lactate dehydrogenase-like 2-hydroxyacid dehydrogenase
VALDDVLMPVPLPQSIRDGLQARFRVVTLWDAADPAAKLAEIAPRLRYLATGVPILAEGQAYPVTDAVLAQLPNLRVIANLGVGYDKIDIAAAARRGIVVTNTPDVLTDETADTAMGLLLCAVRQLPQADAYLRAGRWASAPFPLTASLRGRTMGILGLGRIGKAIAQRAERFGVRIIYHGRRRQPDVAYPFFDRLEDMARACDILMVATPGGPETHRIVGTTVLDALGPDGILVNIARGTIVDEPALIAALRDRRILTAGLDVFADEPHVPHELATMPHVVLLPHVGSASVATRDAMNRLVVDNLVAVSEGRPPLTPVAETPWIGQR